MNITDFAKKCRRFAGRYKRKVMQKYRYFKWSLDVRTKWKILTFFGNCNRYVKRYSLWGEKSVQKNTVYFIMLNEPEQGLTDNLKTIIGSYYIAQQNGFDFKIVYDNPFSLREYLKPNKQNWVTNTGELNFCIRNSRIITYTGYEINRLNRRIRQYHIYRHAGFDVLKQCNVPDSDLLWRTLFNELFCPSELLLKKIESFHIEENTYIAVVLRFLNALEPFEENLKPFYDNSLHSPEDKQRLMTKCIDAINKLQIRYGTTTKILVFSDSRLFLNKVKDELSDIVVLDGKIGNIRNNYSQTIMNEVALKSFVDFFMISRASKVYRICAPEMYYSAFPVYAAVAGGKEFESVNTDTNF